jgi:hypothetical protein
LLEQLSRELEASPCREWLLLWNVLEALVELGVGDAALCSALERRLSELEVYHAGRHPIATGLGWIAARKQAR